MVTTDFYTFPKRTVYENSTPQRPITDNLIPVFDRTGLETENEIVIDWGKVRPFTHIYFKATHVERVGYRLDTDLMGSGSPTEWFDVPLTDDGSPSMDGHFYKLSDTELGQYIRFSFQAVSGQTPFIEAILPCELLLSFKDGSFNHILYTPHFPTRKHHRLLSGGNRPFQVSTGKKRRMSFAADHVPYVYVEGRTSYAYERADIVSLNRVFDDHLEFLFADSLDMFPDRVLVGSFEKNALEQSFSTDLKDFGYDVGFTVCEV